MAIKSILSKSCLLTLGLIFLSPNAGFAQNSQGGSVANTVTDEVIAYGKRGRAGNRAMRAFNAGDYATAEIEFENHYQSLNRAKRALTQAAQDISNSSITNQITTGIPQTSGGGATSNAINLSASNTGASNAASQANIKSITTLNQDGKVTYEDFAFSRYMSGLSQIQLGKFSEAKKSLTESLKHNYRNYDARMRLGLLELRDADYEAAAKHLEKLNKQRKNCGKGCKDLEALNAATLTLGRALSGQRS